ncbi:GntR family transcriptional regulator [Streptomyces diacarni]|uniref:GntR family transcriptional regulator n=1 Tax=Streptomyces diacarni TaxID=2800381 RepID=UPI003408F37F
MNEPAYRQLADDLRDAIRRGDHPEGSVLPRITDLADRYGIAKQTAREAITILESEGLLEVVRRRGTVVRHRAVRRRLTRGRRVHRDERGYYFDATAQSWTALSTPTVNFGSAPREIAARLGLEDGDDVLIRHRIMGDSNAEVPRQLATSYLPAALARGTRLAETDTGPGGIYDRLEEMGHRPLSWDEAVTARTPTPAEAEALRLPRGVPLLCVTRTTTGPDGTVLEINDTRMNAEHFEVGYPLTRTPAEQTGRAPRA